MLVILISIALFVFDTTRAGPLLCNCFGKDVDDPNKIWSRFNAKDLSGNNIVEYQIRNIPTKRFAEALLFSQQFLEDEALNKGIRLIFLCRIQ